MIAGQMWTWVVNQEKWYAFVCITQNLKRRYGKIHYVTYATAGSKRGKGLLNMLHGVPNQSNQEIIWRDRSYVLDQTTESKNNRIREGMI